MKRKQRKAPKKASASKGPASSRNNLQDLPNEVLLEIIEYVRVNARLEDSTPAPTRLRREMKALSENSSSQTTKKPRAPRSFRSSFHSFALVNRRVYALCRPMLWQTIDLSQSPHSKEIIEIIPKHGSHVRSMKIHLSTVWWTKPLKVVKAKYQEDWESRCLDPQAVTGIVSHCPRITSLKIACGFIFRTPQARHPNRFRIRLGLLASTFKNLQSFELHGNFGFSLDPGYLMECLQCFPLLKSLSFSWMRCKSTIEGPALLNSVIQLQHLTHLSLAYIDGGFPLWTSEPGPPNLTSNLKSLELNEVNNLTTDQALSFINTWAPNITRLKLRIRSNCNMHIIENLPTTHIFALPALTDLEVWNVYKCDLFLSFQASTNLRRFKYRCIERDSYTKFSQFMIGSADIFPHLEYISLNPIFEFIPHIHGDPNPPADRFVIIPAFEPLRRFCLERGITFCDD